MPNVPQNMRSEDETKTVWCTQHVALREAKARRNSGTVTSPSSSRSEMPMTKEQQQIIGGVDLSKLNFASEEDRRNAERDLLLYGNAFTKNGRHIPFHLGRQYAAKNPRTRDKRGVEGERD